MTDPKPFVFRFDDERLAEIENDLSGSTPIPKVSHFLYGNGRT